MRSPVSFVRLARGRVEYGWSVMLGREMSSLSYLIPANLSTGPGSAALDIFEDFVGCPFFAADLGMSARY
jgi:hypothetical protein